jgi:hypothetical protein
MYAGLDGVDGSKVGTIDHRSYARMAMGLRGCD